MAYIDNKNFEEADWKTEVFSRGYVCEHEGDLKMIDENTCRNLNGDYKNSSLDALSGAAISNMSAAMIG